MKRSIWMKLITCILAFMMLINGILPTNVAFAEEIEGTQLILNKEEIDNGAYFYFQINHNVYDGKWIYAITPGGKTITNYAEVGLIYYEDEDGNYKTPKFNENGAFYIDPDIDYFRVTTIPNKINGEYVIEDFVGDNITLDFYDAETVDSIDPVKLPKTTAEVIEEAITGEDKSSEEDESDKDDLTMEVENTTDDYVEMAVNKGDDASLIETLITKLLLLIGTGLYIIVCLVVGEAFSIEKVIFNDYGNTKLGFFKGSPTNPFIEDSGVKVILNDFFDFFTGLALAVYLIILVYMAIKIMLGSTAEKGSKYKQLLMYWLEGVLILFLFPYIMKYSIQINDAFVSFMSVNKSDYLIKFEDENMSVVEYDSETKLKDVGNKIQQIVDGMKSKTDFMAVMYNKAMDTGWLVMAICWYVMFFQMVGFLIVYFKRVLILIFLIAVFPLVMISYAIDKIGDAKSQAFNNWVKEFMVNVFVQSFHVIAYVLVMSVICGLIENPEDNWILILVALTFISKGDDILRAIFSINSGANTIKGIGSTIAEAAAISSISKGLKGVKERLVGQNSAGRKLYNRASGISQKAWNKAANRVENTRAKLELANMPVDTSATVDLGSLQTPDELEKIINADIRTLLDGNASEEEIRKAADRLTGYINQVNNGDVQGVLDNLTGNLSPEEAAKLDYILQNNALVNGIMVGGREVNINQNVNIILKRIKKEKQENGGELSNETKALLGKIVSSEEELKAASVYGKLNVKKEKSSSNKDSHGRYPSSRGKNSRGRSAARNRTGRANAKNSLDYARNNKASTAKDEVMSKLTDNSKLNKTKKKLTGILKKKKTGPEYKDLSKNNVPTSRAEKVKDPLERAIKYTMATTVVDSTSNNSTTTNYGNKVPKQKGLNFSADKTPRSLSEFKVLKKKAKEDLQNAKPKENINMIGENKSFTIKTGEEKLTKEKEKETKLGATSESKPSAVNTKQNVGADIANKVGTTQDLINIINGDAYISKGDKILEEMFANPSGNYTTYGPNLGKRVKLPKSKEAEVTIAGFLEDKISKANYSSKTKKDFKDAATSIAILNSTEDGDFTAREILNNINSLKSTVKKYENANQSERNAMEEMLDLLNCNIEDYEAAIRVRILNNPDLVGNNREIIEECKAYVKSAQMPSAIRNKLGYNLEDLKEGLNPKYIHSRDTENDGIISDEQRSISQKEYEDKLKRYNLQKEIDERTKIDETEYGASTFAKEGAGLVGDTVKFVADTAISTVGAVGSGFIATGMSTTGKKETITEAATNFFAGYTATNKAYDGIRTSVTGFAKDTKETFTNDFKVKEKKKDSEGPITENRKPYRNMDIDDLRDKTKIGEDLLFSNRKKKNKKE